MAITFNNELLSDLTLVLNQNEERYIKVSNICSRIDWSIKIITSGATCNIAVFYESDEYTSGATITASDIVKQNIKVNGTPTASIAADTFDGQVAPAGIYIKNTSAAPGQIRFSVRGNR